MKKIYDGVSVPVKILDVVIITGLLVLGVIIAIQF